MRRSTLNDQIAESLFGWHWHEMEMLPNYNTRCKLCHASTPGSGKHLGFPEDIPDYSGNPGAAWKVVEVLAKEKGVVDVTWDGLSCVVTVTGWRKGVLGQLVRERAATMPLAVCIAAVAAYNLTDDDEGDESYELREVSNRLDSQE